MLQACDTSPTISVSNVLDNGDGTYYMDISACIGTEGSADGFDLYFNNEINIIGTTITEVTSPSNEQNVATVSVNNGTWLAYFEEYDINGTYFENSGFWGVNCIDVGVIVDQNPEGATICSDGLNEDCLGFTQFEVFTTCGTIPGPCLPNYSVVDFGSINGNISISGSNCDFAPFNDEIIELDVTCSGNFNIVLSQTDGFNAESWLTLAAGCCSGLLQQSMSFFEQSIEINTFLNEGTYYLIVDIFSDLFTDGGYTLDISSDADLNDISDADAGIDQNTCENTATLNANEPNIDEEGQWTIISGNGTIENPSNNITNVSSLSNGDNIFQWSLSNSCTSSQDQVNILVENNTTLNIPDVIYCLDQIDLIANSKSNGIWSVEPNLNISINNVNSNNTYADVTAYGEYTFNYLVCGETISQNVSVQSITPLISSPSNNYFCLETFELNAEISGDPGYWDYEGPSEAQFDDITSTNPTITVADYGVYTFTYFGCGTNNSIIINMEEIEPIISGPTEIYCLETFNLEADVNGDSGYWDYEGPGEAIFSDPNLTNTSVNISEYGTYTFTYYGCGTYSSINIQSQTSSPSITAPNSIYCLEEFNLVAENSNDPGYWDYEGPGEAIFSDPNSINTSVNISEYGSYIFTYYGCGTNSYQEVNVLEAQPLIINPNDTQIIYCELVANLEASVLGNPGYWSFEGPGDVFFNNINEINTDITVSEFGEYQFTYYGCGINSESRTIIFQTIEPEIITDNTIYCGLSTNISGIAQGDSQWFINNSPNNSNVNIVDENSLNTELEVSEYGVYEIGLNDCENTTFINIEFKKVAPHIIAPNFQNCILDATLIAYSEDNNPGQWSIYSGDEGAVFSNLNETYTSVTVPKHGLYTFKYESCDTFSLVTVGFECPLEFSNTITPNGDGNNDYFLINNLNPEIYSNSVLTIYNRWGTIVYTKVDYGLNEQWWNGKTTTGNININDGVYYYVLEIFNNTIKQKEEYSGELHIFSSGSSSSNKDNEPNINNN